jgi:hypothetical protein
MNARREFHKRRRNEMFNEQHGDCYWCHNPMTLLHDHPPGPENPDGCTLDHLFDRTDPRRRKHKNGRVAYVAACWRCNNIRSKVTSRSLALTSHEQGTEK